MSSIQSALLAQPLPTSEISSTNLMPKSKVNPQQDPEKVAKDFESVFSSMMLKEMRKTMEPGSLFGEDSSDIYGGMFDQYLGQHISEAGGLGLARMVRDSLVKTMTKAEQSQRAH